MTQGNTAVLCDTERQRKRERERAIEKGSARGGLGESEMERYKRKQGRAVEKNGQRTGGE